MPTTWHQHSSRVGKGAKGDQVSDISLHELDTQAHPAGYTLCFWPLMAPK